MKIIKRSGIEDIFDPAKIVIAVTKANDTVVPSARMTPIQIKRIAEDVESAATNMNRSLSVEEIQDMVEDQIMNQRAFDVARQYITYRYNRALVRKSNTTDEQILSLIECNNEEVKQENSNKNPTVNSVQRDYMAGEVSKDITKRVLLPAEIVTAHEQGLIHFHDADYFAQHMHNCDLVNLEDMLQNGTVISGTLIETPHSFSTACTIASQICAAVASSQFGGQSFNISHLAPFVDVSRQKFIAELKDEYRMVVANNERAEMPSEEVIDAIAEGRVRKEVAKGVQTIQYQINTLMTTNGQSPFVTIFMWLDENDPYIKDTAIVIEEVLRQRYQGIKNEAGVYITPAFPKLIYVLDENNNLTGGKYDYLTELAVKCSAKRMYPDYISAKKMRENYEGNVFSPMGCRSFLAPWKNEKGEYQFEARFNQGVVSINLPQIGLITGQNEEAFWKLLDERLELCFEALMCRHDALKAVRSDVSPVHWQYGAIARLKKGEKIKLYAPIAEGTEGYAYLYAVTLDQKSFDEGYKQLKADSLNVTKFEETKIEGNINAAKDGILYTSINFDSGWSVYIDGQKVSRTTRLFLSRMVLQSLHLYHSNMFLRGFCLAAQYPL